MSLVEKSVEGKNFIKHVQQKLGHTKSHVWASRTSLIAQKSQGLPGGRTSGCIFLSYLSVKQFDARDGVACLKNRPV